MNKTAFVLAATALAAAIALATPYPGGMPAGGLTSQDYISIAEEDAQQASSSSGGRPLLGAVAPSDPQLGFIAISVTGLTATKTVGGEDTLCKEVILYYWFNWDATGYHPYIIFSQSLYGTYTQWEVQDAAENIGATTIDDEYHPYAWRSRLWIPAAYETGYFKIYVPEEYDGDTPETGSEYMVMTNGVKYVRKGSLPRSAMVVAEFNPAAFTVFQRKTELATSTPKASRLLLATAGPVAQETTDYTFDDPVQFNAPTYHQSWDDVRVGTNTLADALARKLGDSGDQTLAGTLEISKAGSGRWKLGVESDGSLSLNYYDGSVWQPVKVLPWTGSLTPLHLMVRQFSASKNYSSNDIVFYNGFVYVCTLPHYGEWNADHFEMTTLEREITKSLNGYEAALEGAAAELASATNALATVAYSGAFADIASKPTTLSGYGITDALTADAATLTNTVAFATAVAAVSPPTDLTGYAQIITDPASIPASGYALLVTESESYVTNTTEQVVGNVTNIVTTVTTNSYPVLALYSDGTKVWTSDPAEQGAGYYVALVLALLAAAGGFVWRFFAKTTNILKVDPETGAIYYETED